jgi:hypothetical protein
MYKLVYSMESFIQLHYIQNVPYTGYWDKGNV